MDLITCYLVLTNLRPVEKGRGGGGGLGGLHFFLNFIFYELKSFKVKNNTKLRNKSLLIFITLLSSTPEMVYPVSNAL